MGVCVETTLNVVDANAGTTCKMLSPYFIIVRNSVFSTLP
jgi:hypothetical protein